MSEACNQGSSEDFSAIDLQRHFTWHWHEHGIYLAVCSVFVLMGAAVALVPPSGRRTISPEICELIRTRYAAFAVRTEEKTASVGLYPLRGRSEFNVSQEQAARLAKGAGVLGVLRAPPSGQPASLFGRDARVSQDAQNLLGGLVGNQSGHALGVGGYGLSGTGTGGGVVAEGTIGIGNFGTIHRGAQGQMGLRMAHAAHQPTVASDAPLPTIDPNGRFATTYRPGRGHLAWFESALSRNEIPPSVRQLVGDLGSHYAPEMPAPREHALDLRADLERSALPPAGGPVQLRIALRSSDRAPGPRPPLSVHVVLDVSGSMAGEPLENARAAVTALLARLHPQDRFSLTAFETTARVVVPDGAVGPRRQQIAEAVRHIVALGSTNLGDGLALGYREARNKALGPEWVSLVMLLSDGQPNQGVVGQGALAGQAAEAFQAGVQTSAFGVGAAHDGLLMSAIAERGAGGYYYLPHSDAIAAALGAELQSRLLPVAQAVEVRVRLQPDVRLVDVHGSRKLDLAESAQVRQQETAVDAQVAVRDRIRRDRVRDVEGGMRFFIPGFARDDQHVILLGLDLPGGLGKRDIASIELHYKDRLTSDNVSQVVGVHARYANSDLASARTIDASVAATAQGFAAGETLLAAAQWMGSVEETRGRSLLAERAALMRKAAVSLNQPRLATDARHLDDLRALIADRHGIRDPLLLAQVLTTSGLGLLH
jgi:Mg-chelatase subunit ChlD